MKDVNFGDLRAETQRRLDSAKRDSAKTTTPQKDEFFIKAAEDLERSRTTKPGTARRSFEYQGLPDGK